MRVGIVIPAYRAAEWIERTLRSVVAQTHDDWRCLVLNDGPDDGTRAIVARVGDPRIRYRNDGIRRGQLRNFNAAMLDVLGDSPTMIRFLCADDVLYPWALEDMVRIFSRYPRVGLVCAHFDLIDAEDRITARVDIDGRDDLVLSGRDYLVRGVAVGNTLGGPSSVAVRAEAIETAGLFDPRIDYSGDSDLWHRIAAGWDVAWVGRRAGLMYRQHDQSVTRRDGYSEARFADKIRVVRRLAATVPFFGGRWWVYQYTIGWLHALNLGTIAALGRRGEWTGARVGLRALLREGLPLYAPFWLPRVPLMILRYLRGRPQGERILWRRTYAALQPARRRVTPEPVAAEPPVVTLAQQV